MTPERASRVADYIRAELAGIVAGRLRDPRIGMVTITDARVSRDLAFADIHVSSLAARDDDARRALVEALNGAAGYLRSALAQRHSMRTTPKLRFHYDDLIEEGPRLEALIDKAVASDARHPRESDGPASAEGG